MPPGMGLAALADDAQRLSSRRSKVTTMAPTFASAGTLISSPLSLDFYYNFLS
jgi:hypothetical protein